MPLWVSWLKDFDILNIFYDELKIEKMAKFEILIATNGLISSCHLSCMVVGVGWINPLQTLPQDLVLTFDPDPELDKN